MGYAQVGWAHPNVFITLSAQEALPADSTKPGFTLVSGVKRTQEPVTFGVPLPNDTNAYQTSQLLFVGGTPTQYRVLKKWPSSRLQWVLVDALIDLNANQQRTDLFLTDGTTVPLEDLAKDEAEQIVVDTGAAKFWVRKKGFNLFDRVVVGSKEVVSTGSSEGIVLTGTDGANYRATLDPTAEVVIEENGPVRAAIRIKGALISDQQRASLDFTMRMHFYRTKSYAKVVMTLRNASKTRLENVSFQSLALKVKVAFSPKQYIVRDHEGETTGTLAARSAVSLFQGENQSPSFSDPGWEKTFWPTGISGYSITQDGNVRKQGSRTQIVDLFYAQMRADDKRAILVGTRFAAGLWPQSLTLDGDGNASIGGFPAGNDRPYHIRFGSHLTREHIFYFEGGEEITAQKPHDIFFRFQYPIVVKPVDPDWFNQDAMMFYRLVSFKEEAGYLKDKGWPVDDRPDATLNRRPSLLFPLFIDWQRELPERRHSPTLISTFNFLRQQEKFAGAYYLAASQLASYNADISVHHSDDYNDARAYDEIPELRVGSEQVKDFLQLKGADAFPKTPVIWSLKNHHAHALGFWFYLTGDNRIADAYQAWGEHLQRRLKSPPQTAHELGWGLFNLIELYSFTNQLTYQTIAWEFLQRELLSRTAIPGQSGGIDKQRGFYIERAQETSSQRTVSTFGQAAAMIAAYALFHSDGAKDELQADQMRDLLEGTARFVAQELWFQTEEPPMTPGNFGFASSTPVDKAPPEPIQNSPIWQGGVEDAYLALFFGYLVTSEFDFLKKAELLLQASAFNPGKQSWFQDTPGRQMLQYLVENTILFASWKPLPLQAQQLSNGRYRLSWIAPYGARKYWFKFSDKPIVDSLGFDRKTRTYRYDPKDYTAFFAAGNLKDEPAPIEPGFFQALFVSGLPEGKTFYFAGRYLTSDPRPPITEPTEEGAQILEKGELDGKVISVDGGELDQPPQEVGGEPVPKPDAVDAGLGDSSSTESISPVGCQCQGCDATGGAGWGGLLLCIWLCLGWQRANRVERPKNGGGT